SCRAVHSAVGCSVTLKCTSRRRRWLSTISTKSTRKVAVGTVKKSNAIRSLAWFIRNARHACDGGRRGRSMYCETVACETVRPRFSSASSQCVRRKTASQCPNEDSEPSDHDREIADQSAECKFIAPDDFLEGQLGRWA